MYFVYIYNIHTHMAVITKCEVQYTYICIYTDAYICMYVCIHVYYIYIYNIHTHMAVITKCAHIVCSPCLEVQRLLVIVYFRGLRPRFFVLRFSGGSPFIV